MTRLQTSLSGLRSAALALAVLAAPLAHAQPVQLPDWQRAVVGQRGVALALDAGDNVYVAGVAAPSIYDAGVGSVALSRYAANGTLQWASTWNGGAQWLGSSYAGTRVRSVFTDAAGQAYVIGDLSYLNTSVSTGGGTGTVVGVASYGWVVLKFGVDGSLLWASRQFSGSPWVGVRGLVDANGDIVLLVDPNTANVTMQTLKLAGSTGATLWTRTSPNGAKPGGVALTLGGQVAVSMANPVTGLSVVEYDAATGADIARTSYPQASGYYTSTLAVAPGGDIVVAGRSSDGSALFVAAQDATRVPLFASSFTQAVQGTQLAVDGAGRIVVSGPSAAPTATTATAANWVTLKLDRLGNLLQGPWIIDRTALAHELPRDLALAADGAAVVVGAAGVPGSTVANLTQATTVRYAADGSLAWLAATPAAGTAVDAALGRDGSAYVLADTDQTLLHYPAQVPVVAVVPTALSLSSSTVRGGSSVQARLTLSANTGVTVSLRSSHPALVSVPASVVVPAGAGTAAFTVKTTRPRTTTNVTITASANGQARSVVLTVKR